MGLQKNDIQFENLQKSYGDVNVLSSLNLTIESGERLVLLGPSGCGKSTLIRLIAGLEKPTAGVLKMGGRVVNDVDIVDREVAMVFQNYALYPHMTVFDNIAFSLKLRRIKKFVIEQRVREVAKMVEIEPYLDRKPAELSGGQRQRVALARAAVRNAPYFLLDEPLSNLDAILRVNARNDLVEMHEQLRNTMVYVTHDQLEAMTIGHRIAILNDGKLQQVGTPEQIYHAPANRFVASFIGTPPMNLLSFGRVNGVLSIGKKGIDVHEGLLSLLPMKKIEHHGELLLGIRPEKLMIAGTERNESEGKSGALYVDGRFNRRENIGSHYIYHFIVGAERLLLATPEKFGFSTDEIVKLIFPLEQLHFFTNDEEGMRLPTQIDRVERKIIALQSS